MPIEVIEPELPAEEEEESVPQQDETMEEQQVPLPETEPTPPPKMKLFSGKTAPGLRIREQPSFMVGFPLA